MIGALISGSIIDTVVKGKNVALDSTDFPEAKPVDYTPLILLATALLGAVAFIITKNN